MADERLEEHTEDMTELLRGECKKLARTRRMIVASNLMSEEEVDSIITDAGREYYNFYKDKDPFFLLADLKLEGMNNVMRMLAKMKDGEEK